MWARLAPVRGLPNLLRGCRPRSKASIKSRSSSRTSLPVKTLRRQSQFQVTPLVTGSTPVAVATANPLVALFSAPACPSGSSMRVYFQQQSKSTPATTTNWANCHAASTMTFEIAGMYPSTTYQMFAQTDTGGVVTNGPIVNFTTGALPTNITFPTFTTIVAPGSQTDTALKVLLHDPIEHWREPLPWRGDRLIRQDYLVLHAVTPQLPTC